MSIKTLAIGVGLGGCRFAESLSLKLTTVESKNSPIYINISNEELDIFSSTFLNEKVRVGGSYGAGKSREFALKEFSENFDYEDLIDRIKKRVIRDDVDVIMVSFSTGGGTGSSIGPLLVRLLTNTFEKERIIDKNIYPFGIALLPSFAEGIGILQNTLLTINDINKGIKMGNRFMILKNNGTEGSSFTEKCQYVNDVGSKLIADYFRGTTDISIDGVLDINDRKLGLSIPALHAISRMREGRVENSPFITPVSAICKTMMCEIPDEASEIYEAAVSSSSSSILDFKYGYTSGSEGLVAHHGFNNITKETLAYRSRFDDLKLLDQQGDIDIGKNSLDSLKTGVVNYKLDGRSTGSDKATSGKSAKSIIEDYGKID